MRFLTIFIFLFSTNVNAQTMEEKFRQQKNQVIEAPNSKVLDEVVQLWRTMERACHWFHIGPKEHSYSLSTPFQYFRSNSYRLRKKNNEDWEFDLYESFPFAGLPLICVYDNAVWGSTEALEWRGQKFSCNNKPEKSITWPVVVPYVYAKIDENWNVNVKLPSDFEFKASGRQTTAQYEINFAKKTCYFQSENDNVMECKLVVVDNEKLAQQFKGRILYGISNAIENYCR